MSGLCIMLPFAKVETSEKKIDELTAPRSNSMDRSEHGHIMSREVMTEINPIDYDSDDEVDEEISDINSLFEPNVVESQETVSSLEIEKESKDIISGIKTDQVEVKIEVKVEESFRTILCNLLSKCFNRD